MQTGARAGNVCAYGTTEEGEGDSKAESLARRRRPCPPSFLVTCLFRPYHPHFPLQIRYTSYLFRTHLSSYPPNRRPSFPLPPPLPFPSVPRRSPALFSRAIIFSPATLRCSPLSSPSATTRFCHHPVYAPSFSADEVVEHFKSIVRTPRFAHMRSFAPVDRK